MKKKLSTASLWVISHILLILSTVSLIMVAERAVSAVWQKYLFFGYETMGVITLSRRTGAIFLVSSLMLMMACALSKKISDVKAEPRCSKASKWAFLTSCLSVIIYLAIACSPLNAWRP